MEKIEDLLEQIAFDHLSVSTLRTRGGDNLDFYDISVWCLREALVEAFNAGTDHGSSSDREISAWMNEFGQVISADEKSAKLNFAYLESYNIPLYR